MTEFKAFSASPWDEGDWCVTGRSPDQQVWEDTPLWGTVLSKRDAEVVATWLNHLGPSYLLALSKLFVILAELDTPKADPATS